jgi:hypothetical protein
MKARVTRSKTIAAASAAALDAAYVAWRDAAGEAEIVISHLTALGTDLVLVVIYVGGA